MRARPLHAALTAALISLFALTSRARAASVTLAWDANSEADLAGYRIHYSTTPGPPYAGTLANEGPSPVDVPLSSLADVNNPQVTFTGIPSCTHLYFVATAYDTSGNESGYSTSPGPLYEGTGALQGSSPVAATSPAELTGLPSGTTIYVAVEAACPDDQGNRSAEVSGVVASPVCNNGEEDAAGRMHGGW